MTSKEEYKILKSVAKRASFTGKLDLITELYPTIKDTSVEGMLNMALEHGLDEFLKIYEFDDCEYVLTKRK